MSLTLHFGNIVREYEQYMPHSSYRAAYLYSEVSVRDLYESREPQFIPIENIPVQRTPLLVITTNIGWNKQHENVMGAGLARQYRDRIPNLARDYGNFLHNNTYNHQAYYAGEEVFENYQVPSSDKYIYLHNNQFLMVPTKALNKSRPWLSWQTDSTLTIVERSLQQLVWFLSLRVLNLPQVTVYTPLLGCGKGNLDPKVVLPLMVKYMGPQKTNFILVSNISGLTLPEPPPPPPDPTEADLRVAALLGDMNEPSK